MAVRSAPVEEDGPILIASMSFPLVCGCGHVLFCEASSSTSPTGSAGRM